MTHTIASLCVSLVLSQAAAGNGRAEEAQVTATENPLLAPWTGPYGGVPPFDRIRVEHFVPAFEAAMAEHLSELARISADPSPATFENTLAAMERSGRTLGRVRRVYEVHAGSLATPEFQAVQREMAPRLAAFEDRITQDEKLFARVAAVYQARDALDPEQRRLAWLVYTGFVREGARLDAAAKSRVSEINTRLATLETTFQQNLLADEDVAALVLDGGELAGLPAPVRDGMAAAGRESGHPGKWVVLDTRSSVEPFLTYSRRRDLREKAWRAFVERGDHEGPRDNKPVIREILGLRAERARLLGYPTHAHWQLEDQMARTPDRAMALMERVWPAAVARVHEEVAEMQAIADGERPRTVIQPWDYRFYAEKVRKARYDLDENQLKPYLQMEKLREGMFWVAERLFDLHFTPARDVPVFHPDVRVWQVRDGEGALVGLWYFDPFARPGKRSGAWMDAYRAQEGLDGPVTPIVSNNANFVKGAPGETVLVSWDDAVTLFHEFGHALHGLLSHVRYPSLASPAVPRDYVEFPSQLLERWLLTPEVLGRFAVHHRTCKPMPPALVQRLERSAKFNQGFAVTEYLSAAIVDMQIHLAGGEVDPAAFEREALAKLGMPREIVMRHRLPQFAHVFGPGDGYSAGYYSYQWAEVLSADAFSAFTEARDPFDPAVASRLRQLLSEGNTVDPAEAYRAFRGRDPDVAALMRWRGFPVVEKRVGL